jgi:hypothetical protein
MHLTRGPSIEKTSYWTDPINTWHGAATRAAFTRETNRHRPWCLSVPADLSL